MLKSFSFYFSAALFFLIAAALLFSANYLLSRVLIRFFNISSVNFKTFLFSFSAFLSAGFIGVMFLARWQDNVWTRWFYLFFNAWLGFLANLLLAALIIWVATKILHWPVGPKTVALSAVIFAGALIFSVYGIWSAFHPRIKNIEIKIPSLPAAWQGKTVVQLSDVHLGVVHQADFMRRVVEQVNAVKPEMVLITGDLFDGMDGDLFSFAEPLNQISAPQGIYFVSGNHEIYLGEEHFLPALEKTKIKFLNNEIKNINGLQLIGLGYSSFAGGTDIKKIIESSAGYVKNLPTVLVYHTPTNTTQAKAAGVNLQLSGHAHKGQLFPVAFFEWLIYKKYYYGLHQGGDYAIYASAGVGTWGPPLRTGAAPEIVAVKLLAK